MKTADSQELMLKKQTLSAWARILYRQGMIDFAKLGRMLALIDKLNESKPEGKACS